MESSIENEGITGESKKKIERDEEKKDGEKANGIENRLDDDEREINVSILN